MALSTLVNVAGSAISTIIEWAGSAVVGEFLTMGFSYLSARVLPANSVAELNRLHTALPQIRDVMGIAEALKEKDPSTSKWVERFRQAVEASEDVLDELEYKKLEDKVKTRDEAGGSTSSSKKRKVSALNDDTLERLKKALTLLDGAAVQIDHLLQRAKIVGIDDLSQSQQETSKVSRRETTAFLTETKVFGREVEKGKIIGWLKRPTDAPLSSFGIVGVGGLGKTTLAQFAYQEMHGSNHFDKTIWVCVSTNFNVEDITRKMLGELGESSSGKPLNALQEALKKKIHSKKLLIILDDIWDDKKMSDWEQLVAPLRFAQQGSKILFTTRMKSAADLLESVIRTEHESLALQGLGEQELRLLFQSYAFYGFNLYNHRDLQAIGDQILEMLRGSPLAAKVIGSLLNSCMENQHWQRVLKHGSLFNLEQAKDVVEVLKLSYYHLPPNLQVCFRFCSIFPQDHKFDKDDLIKMWICSGFVRQKSGQEERPEDIGEDYFNLLLRKSFFELHSDKGKTWYTMHDLIHELAQNVSYGECYRIEYNNKGSTIPSTVRHVFVEFLGETAIKRVSHLENLRSLVINNCFDMSSLNNLIKKPLRLLKINVYGDIVKLPEEISCLVHLRYLSIRQNWGSQQFQYSFLGSIYKLYHLQVLEFSTDSENTSHPRIETTGITNLPCLRYMRLPNNTIEPICEIHKLTSLQELTFRIGKEIGYRIDELHTLNNLRHLSIENIENIGDHTEAKSANLLGKNDLMSLSLKWGIESNPIHHEKTIDLLQPPPRLRELTIKNYNGQRCPNWMEGSLSLNLSFLKLLNCPFWKNQLFSGYIPYLKILDIRDCQNLDKLPNMPLSLIEFRIYNVGLTSLPALYQNSNNNTSALRVVEIEMCPNLISFHGFLQQDNLGFPAIEELTIKGCERLVHLPTHGFGNLMSLNIMDCPNLTEFPTLLPLSLIHFRIKNVGLSALPEYYRSPDSTSDPSTSSLIILQIENCQNLRSFNGFLQQDNIDYSSIEELTIKGLEGLVHLPTHGFGKLKLLNIMDCPNLTEFPTLLPLSLIQFRIKNVGLSALPEYYRSPDSSSDPSTSSLIIVQIENCQNLRSLNGFLQQDNIDYSSIKKLTIKGLEGLVHLPTHGFGKLKSLNIMDCPNLTEFPTLLPLSLIHFRIKNVGLSALPEYYRSPDSSSDPSTSSLIIVQIENCQNLRSLNGFLQQDNIDYSFIEELTIKGLEGLVHLPTHGFGKLKLLNIMDCPNLTEFPTLLPLSLIQFRIKNVGLSALPEYYRSPDSSSDPSTSSLIIVQIENCQNLRSFNGFLQQDNIDYSSIEELTIKGLEGLVHLPTHGFGKLKLLNIMDCPNLTEFPTLLPLSLIHFRIKNVGLSALPEYYRSPDSSSDPSTSSLKIVQIENCQNLRSLNGFLQQDNIDFQSIEKIEVNSCENLVHLPMGAFGKFVSLQNLSIENCPMLMAVDKQSTLLPMALEYLLIDNCGKVDEPLLESASSLPTLASLWIINCANISRFPSSENAFRSLNWLHISKCEKLIEHSPREKAHGTDRGSSMASLKIENLNIDNLYLLLIEPLRSLSFVSDLTVSSCSWMEALLEQWCLQNSSTLKKLTLKFVENLNTLPATMVRLTVLEWLTIIGVDLLEELPELPASLRKLEIWFAKSLKSLPVTMAGLTALETLIIFKADLLEELPELPVCLRKLEISGAKSLKSLPVTMAGLTALETLIINKADLLEKLPELPVSLKEKKIKGCGGRLL